MAAIQIAQLVDAEVSYGEAQSTIHTGSVDRMVDFRNRRHRGKETILSRNFWPQAGPYLQLPGFFFPSGNP
jgi:hypothetical protein